MALYTAKLIQEKQLLKVTEFKAHQLPLDVLIKYVKTRLNVSRKRLKVLDNKTNLLIIGNKSLKIEISTNLQNTKFN